MSVRHTARLALSCSRKMSVLTWLGCRAGVGVGVGVEVWVGGRVIVSECSRRTSVLTWCGSGPGVGIGLGLGPGSYSS